MWTNCWAKVFPSNSDRGAISLSRGPWKSAEKAWRAAPSTAYWRWTLKIWATCKQKKTRMNRDGIEYASICGQRWKKMTRTDEEIRERISGRHERYYVRWFENSQKRQNSTTRPIINSFNRTENREMITHVVISLFSLRNCDAEVPGLYPSSSKVISRSWKW